MKFCSARRLELGEQVSPQAQISLGKMEYEVRQALGCEGALSGDQIEERVGRRGDPGKTPLGVQTIKPGSCPWGSVGTARAE